MHRLKPVAPLVLSLLVAGVSVGATSRAEVAGTWPVLVLYEQIDRYEGTDAGLHRFEAASWNRWRDVVIERDDDAAPDWTTTDAEMLTPSSVDPSDGRPTAPGPLFNPGVTRSHPDRLPVAAPRRQSTIDVARRLGLNPFDVAATSYEETWSCTPGSGPPDFCSDGSVRSVTSVVFHRPTDIPLEVDLWEDGTLVLSLRVINAAFGSEAGG